MPRPAALCWVRSSRRFRRTWRLSPLSPTALRSLRSKGYCSAFAGAYGLPCVTLRFSNIYGPYSAHKKSVVAAFIKRMLRRGAAGRLWRWHPAAGLPLCRRSRARHRGRARPAAPRDLSARLRQTHGASGTDRNAGGVSGREFKVHREPPRAGEVHSTWCNIGKAREAFGYAAPTAVDRAYARRGTGSPPIGRGGAATSSVCFGLTRDAWLRGFRCKRPVRRAR